ncbi:hypothetical protein SAY86_023212 [Trapa natans]|uniref:Uncharacterized protein n=1 Tax=Trapa natans TaxID=22666 RepID=A0AAN7LUN1_TRANT|nr:hypothetical protein SAY86_023212 [Trapa natans]
MAFWGTRVLEIVKKHDSGGLVWKRIKLTTTRKANAKKRLLRVWQTCSGNNRSNAFPCSSKFKESISSMEMFLVAQCYQVFLLQNEAVLRACSGSPLSKTPGFPQRLCSAASDPTETFQSNPSFGLQGIKNSSGLSGWNGSAHQAEAPVSTGQPKPSALNR